jgi:4-amino-4-deoxy-L-arabinose transferase-like glycosyltransferase
VSAPTANRSAPAPARLPPFGRGAMTVSLGILVAAAFLRLAHIGSGIPFAVAPDEPQIMIRVAQMLKTGDFNPHFFDWPSLTFYLNLVGRRASSFSAAQCADCGAGLGQVGAAELYFGGRVFTALLGTATVAVTMAAGRRWGTTTALVSGALMAVVSPHVRESHYVLTDVPTAFFTTLTLWLSLRAIENQTMPRLLWAAAAAGLAASCKYNGSIAIVMPLIVAWAGGDGFVAGSRRALAVAGVGLVAFLAGTPYAVLDLPKFLNDYARLASAFATRPIAESGWTLYPKHILGAIGWPALLAAMAGFGLALRDAIRGPARVRSLLVVGFAAAYFVVMARSHQIFGRYLLPLYPDLALLCGLTASTVVAWLSSRQMHHRWLATSIGAVLIALVAIPTAGAVGFVRDLGRPSTARLAYDWFLNRVPPGTKVAVEAGALRLPNAYVTIDAHVFLRRSYDEYVADGRDRIFWQHRRSFRPRCRTRPGIARHSSPIKGSSSVHSWSRRSIPRRTSPDRGLRIYQVRR